ncbi:hypothetical protein FBD94_18235 [Pedobacter hiemivivus]|uniref:RagB/SusD family nutrient uptake outer membrane protein n=1 Tax=Pedobacter hiemivivus TaxID=2530454 RepID=A0A4U1G4L5_9SPHI|nr:hypothetical protein [Pedobacter hiemivivus]TKC58555.1 hypothetical protein FBD94_18235 [Pedobacter hiemivivus]
MSIKIKDFWKAGVVCICVLMLSSCDKWVNDTELPDNTIDESQLNSIAMLGRIEKGAYIPGPVIAGVWRAGATSAADLLVASGAISDEIVPTAVPNSPFYKELDEDKLTPDNTSLFSVWSNIQNYRARAEDAILNAESLAPADEDGVKVKQAAFVNARLHAGYAWMLLADYFSVTNTSHSIYADHKELSHQEAYGKAKAYWEQAIPTASDAEKRLLHSLLAKMGIHTGNYSLAVQYINQSFGASENFSFLNTVGTVSNGFFNALNVNSRDAAVDPTLVVALKTTADKARNPVVKAAKGHWSLTLFKERDPLVVSDYEEMQLIRAELIIRGLLTGNATDLVNSVVVKYDATGLSNFPAGPALTLNDIVSIRRIFLSWRGTRLIDLRRFNIDGDLIPGFTQRKWQWIGVPEIETQK